MEKDIAVVRIAPIYCVTRIVGTARRVEDTLTPRLRKNAGENANFSRSR